METQRGLNQRPILGAGLLVLMALSAGAYVYWVLDESNKIANRPSVSSAPAATPAPAAAPTATLAPTATPAPAASRAPATVPAASAIAAEPTSSGPPSEPTARQAPATQAPINIAPVAAAEPAAAPPASLQQQPASLPKEDVVFVQKPGVRMRSEPGRHGKVIGAPPKGSRFRIVGRAGSWVQVEGDAGRGWIGGRMLGRQSP